MNLKKIVADCSGTSEAEWAFVGGIETLVESEYWLVHEASGRQATVCIKASVVSSLKVYDAPCN